MPIKYDITKDSFYLEGLKKKEYDTIVNMFNNDMEVKLIAEIMEVTQKYVKQIQKEMQSDK